MVTASEVAGLSCAGSADVLVCGGGTAGAVAAIAAARSGARVIVAEQYGALGGTQTQGWVTPMMPNKRLEESLSFGIDDEILSRAAAIDPPPTARSGDLLWFNPATLAVVLDDMVGEAGVRVLFGAWASDAVLDGARLVGVVVETRAGRQRIDAAVTVDCTGDAVVAARAGVPCEESGEPQTGRRQPASLRFTMGNIDIPAVARYLIDELGMACYSRSPLFEIWAGDAESTPLGPSIRESLRAGLLEPGDLGYLQVFSMLGRPRELAFNCPRLFGVDPNDPWSVSAAYAEGRRRIRRIAAYFQAKTPGFEEAYVSVVAPMLGLRESRRIVGEYVLTESDYLSEARFDDAIARNAYPMDIHTPTGTELRRLPPVSYHEIPYRCMVPLGVDALLVAGRCVSATFAAQSAIRIQRNCRAMGEAAGVAAALCVQSGIMPRQVHGRDVRRRLGLDDAAPMRPDENLG